MKVSVLPETENILNQMEKFMQTKVVFFVLFYKDSTFLSNDRMILAFTLAIVFLLRWFFRFIDGVAGK